MRSGHIDRRIFLPLGEGINFKARVDPNGTFGYGKYHIAGGVHISPHRAREFGMSFYASNPTKDFVPNGSAVKQVHQVVLTQSCNQCHDPLALHMLSGEIQAGETIRVSKGPEGLVFIPIVEGEIVG